LLFTYPKASIKNVQAQEKLLALKREHPALEFYFLFFWGNFCPSGSGSGSRDPIESGFATLLFGNFISIKMSQKFDIDILSTESWTFPIPPPSPVRPSPSWCNTCLG
jgi:hypothetical protein